MARIEQTVRVEMRGVWSVKREDRHLVVAAWLRPELVADYPEGKWTEPNGGPG